MLFIPPAPPSAAAIAATEAEKLAKENIFKVLALALVFAAIAFVADLADTDLREEMPLAAVPFVAVFGALFYFVPSLVAAKKTNFTAILILNALLGWTLLGWVGALVWASVKEKPASE